MTLSVQYHAVFITVVLEYNLRTVILIPPPFLSLIRVSFGYWECFVLPYEFSDFSPGFMNMLLKSTSDMCGRTEGEFEVEQNHGTQSYVSCTRMPWLAFYGTFICIAQSTEFKAETEKHRISYHYHQMCSGDRKSHGPMGTVCITSLNVVNCISKEKRGNSLYGAWERHSFLLGSKQSSIGTEFTQQDTVEKAITFTLQMSLEFW